MIERCFFCRAYWGSCSCGFPSSVARSATPSCVDGFDYGRFFVTAPNVDESGRFYVDPRAYYGEPFEVWNRPRFEVFVSVVSPAGASRWASTHTPAVHVERFDGRTVRATAATRSALVAWLAEFLHTDETEFTIKGI